MAVYLNSFEGGSNGTTMTAANSGGGSGSPFSYVPAGVIAFSNVQKSHGALSARISNPGTVYANMQWALAVDSVLVRGYFYFADTIPATGSNLIYVNGTANVVLVLQSGGRLQMYSGGNRGTMTTGLAANTWYRIELLRTGATLRFAVYEGENITPLFDSGLVTGLTLGSVTNVSFGKVDAVEDTGVRYVDSVGAKTDTDAIWGAWTAINTAPTADAGGHQLVAPGATVQLDGSGSSDPDSGTSLTYQWSFLWPLSSAPTLSGATTVSPTFTAGAAGAIYALQLQVGDGAATSTSTVNIAVSTSAGSSAASELVWTGSAWE